MKILDRDQQRILGMTKSRLQFVNHTRRLYYYDESFFSRSKL